MNEIELYRLVQYVKSPFFANLLKAFNLKSLFTVMKKNSKCCMHIQLGIQKTALICNLLTRISLISRTFESMI